MKPKLAIYAKIKSCIIENALNPYDLDEQAERNCPEGYKLVEIYTIDNGDTRKEMLKNLKIKTKII